MSAVWPDSTLGEFVRLQRGHDLTASEQQPGDIPIMGSAGPNGTHSTALANGPGVVVGRSGASAGRVHFSEVDYWPHNTCLYVTDFLGNSPRFAYYLLQTLDLASFNSGSAQPSLNRNFLYSIPLKIPARLEQDGIVSMLSALDDRITLLRETNATLEAIAQALFKSWFVDFDPVRAKMEGRAPEGMDEATAGLFPDSFEESALGLVPRGWRVGVLTQISKISSGNRPNVRSDTMTDAAPIPLFGGAGIMGFTNESLFQVRKILTGRVGTLGKVHVAYPPFWASDNVLVLSPEESRNFLFCFHWLKLIDVHSLNRGSTQPLLTQKDLGKQQHAIPTVAVLNKFAAIAEVIYEAIRDNAEQAQTLATLRDTLLPRLISGQLRLPEAESATETALA